MMDAPKSGNDSIWLGFAILGATGIAVAAALLRSGWFWIVLNGLLQRASS